MSCIGWLSCMRFSLFGRFRIPEIDDLRQRHRHAVTIVGAKVFFFLGFSWLVLLFVVCHGWPSKGILFMQGCSSACCPWRQFFGWKTGLKTSLVRIGIRPLRLVALKDLLCIYAREG